MPSYEDVIRAEQIDEKIAEIRRHVDALLRPVGGQTPFAHDETLWLNRMIVELEQIKEELFGDQAARDGE